MRDAMAASGSEEGEHLVNAADRQVSLSTAIQNAQYIRPSLTSSMSSWFLKLCEDERTLALSFVIAHLPSFAQVAALCRQVHQDVHSLGAWRGAAVLIQRQNLAQKERIVELSKRWALVREVHLPAHPERPALHKELRLTWPELPLRTVGEGPYLLFVMRCNLHVGSAMGLHFFEPRYRWMCRRLFEDEGPHMFGFVTTGKCCGGARGILCNISEHTMNTDGTFDVFLTATASFSLLEVWQEDVPEFTNAPPLAVGFVDLGSEARAARIQNTNGTSGASVQRQDPQVTPTLPVRFTRLRRFTFSILGMLLCCRRRA